MFNNHVTYSNYLLQRPLNFCADVVTCDNGSLGQRMIFGGIYFRFLKNVEVHVVSVVETSVLGLDDHAPFGRLRSTMWRLVIRFSLLVPHNAPILHTC